MKKILARIVASALVCATLAQTAWAATNDNKKVLKGMFQRVDYWENYLTMFPKPPDGQEEMADHMPVLTEIKYKGGQLTEEQLAIVENISYDVDVEAIIKNNVSIKPILVVGDKNIAYVVWEITTMGERFSLYYGGKPDIQSADGSDGRKLDGLQYAFDNMDRSYQLRHMMAENYDAFSTVTVGGNPPGSYGISQYIEIIKDENPNDNKLWLLTTIDETHANINLTGQVVNYHITDFSERFGSKSDINYTLVAKGPWDFSFLLDYKDLGKKNAESVTVQKRLGSASETMQIESVEISPISLLIRGIKREVDRDHFPITLKKKDGTTRDMEIYVSGYGGQVIQDGRTTRNFRAKHLFEEPLDVDEIVSIIIGGTELPLK